MTVFSDFFQRSTQFLIMSTVDWNDKEGIISLLGNKYNVPQDEIKRCFRQQLINKMTEKELMVEITKLTGDDVVQSQQKEELRGTLSKIVCGKYMLLQ